MHRPEFPKMTKASLKLIASLYDLSGSTLKELRNADNIVYESMNSEDSVILRVSHGQRRTFGQLVAELNWLRLMKESGIFVCVPIQSKHNRLVEVIEVAGVELLVTGFKKLCGSHPTKADWSGQLFERWGRCQGQLHFQASKAQLEGKSFNRPLLREEPNFALREFVPNQHRLLQRADALIGKIESFPTDRSCYGLIHGDMHRENIFLHEGLLTVLDFDDLQYGWFAQDIAISLYYARWQRPQEQATDDYDRHFMSNFLKGYRSAMSIDPVCLGRINDFMQLRHVFMYGNHHRTWNLDTINQDQKEGLARHRRGIEEAIPLAEVDFSVL
jgi:Ser/Thr protein kinase RdoA (MazF antagonist)